MKSNNLQVKINVKFGMPLWDCIKMRISGLYQIKDMQKLGEVISNFGKSSEEQKGEMRNETQKNLQVQRQSKQG